MFSAVVSELNHLRLMQLSKLLEHLDTSQIGVAFAKWLSDVPSISQVQLEQGLDLIELRFYFSDEIFYGHYEHYTDSFWLDTDSAPALMLLSNLAYELQKHIEQTFEFN